MIARAAWLAVPGELPERAVRHRQRFQKALGRIEALGIVLARPALVEKHTHVALLELWSQRFLEPLGGVPGVREFVHAAVMAAGNVPEKEVMRWFAWPRGKVEGAIGELVSSGRVVRVEGE